MPRLEPRVVRPAGWAVEPLRRWLLSFFPAAAGSVDQAERLRAALGVLLGLLLTGAVSGWFLHQFGGPPSSMASGTGHAAAADWGIATLPWLIAPLGASAVLLFAVPASPLAQPWSIMGGNLVAAVIGVSCAKLIGDPLIAASAACSIAILAMFTLRCIHPPSGAVALTAVLGGHSIHQLGFLFVLLPVGLNSLLLVAVALAFNNARGRIYPHPHETRALVVSDQEARVARHTPAFTSADLDRVLAHYNQVLDISRTDLEEILIQTEQVATERRIGARACADIMSREPIAVEFGTSLNDAWQLFRRHALDVLPVLDRQRRVIGVLTLTEFLRQADPESYSQVGPKLGALLRRPTRTHNTQAEVAGQIMRTRVAVIHADAALSTLRAHLPQLAQHTIPVVDEQARLVGLLSQSQVLEAFCGHWPDA